MEGGRIRSRSAKPYLAGQGSDPEGKNHLKNRLRIRLRIRLRLNFDSMTCLNYIFLDFFQYRKSQADSQADSQAVFQAVFSPSGSDPRCPNDRPEMHELILI